MNGPGNSYADLLEASIEADERKLETVGATVVKKPFNLDTAVRESNVLVSEDIEEPPKCLSIQNEDSIATIATLGNFSLLIGKAKGKKSFLVQLFVNAAINQNDREAFIVSTLPTGKRKVLVIDTEQGRYRSQKILKRAGRQANGHEDNLLVHDLRSYNPAERLQIAEYLIYNTPGLGLVFIDGVRDLVTSVNDEIQATDMSSNLLRWSADLQIHICVVLHQNKNDANARGHLGTELVNKAETVLSATKDPTEPSMSIVQAEACRDKEFLPFAFCINEEGLPIISSNYIHAEAKTRQGAWKPEDISIEQHLAVLGRVYPSNNSPFLKYSGFMELMVAEFAKDGISISKDRSSKLKIYYVSTGLLSTHGSQPSTVYKHIKAVDKATPK